MPIVFCVAALAGCSKKDAIAPYVPTDSIGRIDKWIADSLRRYYYWSDEMPGKPDHSLMPDKFFQTMLSKSDRFSWVSNGVDILPASNSYFMYGFHYAFVAVSGYDGLVGVVTAVNEGGPAQQAGLRRGSYFLAVNGQRANRDNLAALNVALRSGSEVQLMKGAYNGSAFVEDGAVGLSAGFSGESPVRMVRVFNANGIVTGYLNYNSFNEYYDDLLLAAVNKLRTAGVSELVLDLRYNAGGHVSSCAKLAALLASKMSAQEIFAIFSGNRYEGKKTQTLQAVLNTSGNAAGRTFQELQGLRLSLQRVFILTTRGTVSAAELIVNNLKPFVEVIQIGDTTRGKNEAGFVIEDYRNPQQVAWSMEPTVYKLFNKNSQGNYEAGLAPRYPVLELSQLPLHEIGTTGDLLLHEALQLIYGNKLPESYTELGLRRDRLKATAVYQSVNDTEGRCLLTNH
jgi:C-terminal processing protease CtpA/Prc